MISDLNLSAFQFSCLLVTSLLTFSSLVAFILIRWKPYNSTFQKVLVIIRSWWAIAGFFLIALSWHKWGLIIAMGVISLLAIREYLKVSKIEYKKYFLVVLSLLCVIQYLLLAIQDFILFTSMIPILCLWIVPGLVIFRSTIKDLELVAGVGFGLSLLIYYLSHISALTAFSRHQLTEGQSTMAVLILILVTWSNDVFQFISGKTFGGKKIFPNVSPNKTLGGFVGGLIGTLVLTTVLACQLLLLEPLESVALGLLLGVTGMFGDLFFSAVKRNIGVKDFSQVLPGHGGYLDRLDSLIFTAPAFLHYLLLVGR
jgi:phosphatidate cytidylyltransferase